MELIRPFERLGKGDAGIAGGKGASLGEMAQASIPVPPGFVVLSSAFERFLAEADLNQELDTIFHTVSKDELRTVELASERIQSLIRNATMPEDIADAIRDEFKKLGTTYVAVRSSATAEDSSTAAWAGQLDTYLNTTEENLLENVQRCWASLFTPRAIFYRFEKGMHGSKISVAVVVQKMVQSEVSGIAFSVHPVTEDYNQLIIEGGFGLGEAIVSGQVTPDSFVIEKEPRRIIDKNITFQSRALWRAGGGGNEWRDLSEEEGNKPALSDEQALELGELVLTIEKHYDFPCDIEWAFEAGHFYITQSRPITTLSNKASSSTSTEYNVADYELTFEGDGMTYGFEYALYTYYWPTQGLSIIVRGHVQEFMRKRYLQWMDAHGLTVTPEQIHDIVAQSKRALNAARDRMEEILAEKLTAASIEQAVTLGGEIMRAYNLLDPHFWDSLYEKSQTDADALAVIKVVGEYKNVVREYFNEFYFGEASWMGKLYQKLSEQTGIAKTELEMCTTAELIDALSGRRLSNETLETRRDAFVIIKEEGTGIRSLEGADAHQFIERFFEGKQIASGTVAHGKGAHAAGRTVRGKVCIITRDYSDVTRMQRQMESMEQGAILVTQTTDPEMMPALRKASAAVTDIGGLLSHTAITARELNIPCIVDTKIATQIFKNGDMVEVDAERGIVRKI